MLLLSIINLSTNDINGIVGWAGTLVGDLMPLIIIVIGISIGIWVVTSFLRRGD